MKSLDPKIYIPIKNIKSNFYPTIGFDQLTILISVGSIIMIVANGCNNIHFNSAMDNRNILGGLHVYRCRFYSFQSLISITKSLRHASNTDKGLAGLYMKIPLMRCGKLTHV